MSAGSIGRRYSKAILDLAIEQKKVDEFLNQLKSIQTLLQSSKDISFLLIDPAFQVSERKKVFEIIAEKLSLHDSLKNFLKLLIDRERIAFFDDIVSSFQEQSDDFMKRVRVTIKTSTPLNSEEEKHLKSVLEKLTGKEAILEIKTDETLLGGLVVKVRDMVFDGSLKNTLHQIKESMLSVGV